MDAIDRFVSGVGEGERQQARQYLAQHRDVMVAYSWAMYRAGEWANALKGKGTRKKLADALQLADNELNHCRKVAAAWTEEQFEKHLAGGRCWGDFVEVLRLEDQGSREAVLEEAQAKQLSPREVRKLVTSILSGEPTKPARPSADSPITYG